MKQSPRLASVFATQQRWLMAHVGLALHFRRDPRDHRTELTVTRFIEAVRQHSVASRNTADAFIKEMLHYHIVEYLPTTGDGRAHPFQVTAATLKEFDRLGRCPSANTGQSRWRQPAGHVP